jgi:hypothetical protein
MRALKIATKDQRTDIRSRCQALLNEAERIKLMPDNWVQVQPDLTDSMSSLNLQSQPSSDSTTNLRAMPTPSLSPGNTPAKQMPTKRLVEPVSKRELTRSEQILLLRGAKLNGFQFPPWTGPPNPREFELQAGDQPFLYVFKCSLEAILLTDIGILLICISHATN